MFFGQAEDGIRDLVRSRGLGYVYKRQQINFKNALLAIDVPILFIHKTNEKVGSFEEFSKPVSYTHLTLPTSDLV